jgi:hypothetical protein
MSAIPAFTAILALATFPAFTAILALATFPAFPAILAFPAFPAFPTIVTFTTIVATAIMEWRATMLWVRVFSHNQGIWSRESNTRCCGDKHSRTAR